jgi:DUF971 family protein
MKATQLQYTEAVTIYEKSGQYAVYDYAHKIGINEWSYCKACEDETPDCNDKSCLVCGSTK